MIQNLDVFLWGRKVGINDQWTQQIKEEISYRVSVLDK